MRTFTTARRAVALTATCFAASSALSSAALAVTAPAVTKLPGGTVKAVGTTYDVGTSYRVTCPGDGGPSGCRATVTMQAVVHPKGKAPRLALVGRGSSEVAAGGSERITVRLTALGAAELRLRGNFRGRLYVRGTNAAAQHVPGSTDATRSFTREQIVLAPPLVLTNATRLESVSLAPGQRLTLRLRENPSTGYAWKVAPLTAAAHLRLVSSAIVVDGCAGGIVGCPAFREVQYVGLTKGSTPISAALYAPGAQSAPAARFGVRVASSDPLRITRVLTAAANGTTVGLLSVGTDFVVRLTGASASTGYSWQNVPGAQGLTPLVHAQIPNDCDEPSTGCGQIDEFTFASTGPNDTVSLALLPPAGTTPAQSFSLSLMSPIP